MNLKFNVIDLFAGCGGFSQGFNKAGFNILVANEFWSPAAKTYKLNHPETTMIEDDIRFPNTKKKIYEIVKNKPVHVIIGGPPCQGYSISGNRNPEDPRGKLYEDFLDVVNYLKPNFFVMENVKGLVHMKHINPNLKENEKELFKANCYKLQRYKDLKRYKSQRGLEIEEKNEFEDLKISLKSIKKQINSKMIPLLDKILQKIKEIGYNVKYKILNAADYGVPQTRERIIFIGSKKKQIDIKFPKITHTKNPELFLKQIIPWITSFNVLKKYENWKEDEKLNHIFTSHSQKFIKKLEVTKIGENVYKNYGDSFWRLIPNRPARTVKENHGGVFVHYKDHRVCTPRELAALQSFEDDFIFKGSKSDILKQIGNAVPPLLSKNIGEKIRELLYIDLNLKSKNKYLEISSIF